MHSVLRVACVMTVLGSPAAAQEVVCGEKWVSFIPFARNVLDLASVRFHMRKSDIQQGRLVPNFGGIGFLHVRKGAGWGDGQLRMPGETYTLVMRCVVGPLVGHAQPDQ